MNACFLNKHNSRHKYINISSNTNYPKLYAAMSASFRVRARATHPQKLLHPPSRNALLCLDYFLNEEGRDSFNFD